MDGIDAYLDRLASDAPTPGGGSAATLVGAMGAALCAMVARITARAPRHASVHTDAEALVERADRLRERFAAAREVDESAFARVVAAQALPRADAAQKAARTEALQEALAGAAEAPLAVAGMCAEGIALAARAAALRNEHLTTDVECAVQFFRAALGASVANVRINHRYLRDPSLVAAQGERLTAIAAAAQRELDAFLPALQ